MNITQKNDFLNIFQEVAEGYGRGFSVSIGEMYWHVLNFFNLTCIKAALAAHQNDQLCGRYMPLPADIIRHIKAEASLEAEKAWQKVLFAIQRMGVYSTVVFEDTVIHAVIEDIGGWVKLCQMDEKTLCAKGAEFEKHYVFYRTHATEYYFPPLSSLEEDRNKQLCFKNDQPNDPRTIH